MLWNVSNIVWTQLDPTKTFSWKSRTLAFNRVIENIFPVLAAVFIQWLEVAVLKDDVGFNIVIENQ